MRPNDLARRPAQPAGGRERTTAADRARAAPTDEQRLREGAIRLRREIIDATASQFSIPAPLQRRLSRAHALLDAVIDGPTEVYAARAAIGEAGAALSVLVELGWVRTSVAPPENHLPVAKTKTKRKRPRRR